MRACALAIHATTQTGSARTIVFDPNQMHSGLKRNRCPGKHTGAGFDHCPESIQATLITAQFAACATLL